MLLICCGCPAACALCTHRAQHTCSHHAAIPGLFDNPLALLGGIHEEKNARDRFQKAACINSATSYLSGTAQHCLMHNICQLAPSQADGNSTGVGNPKGYCYAEQPPWSAYRESSFGHGTLDVINATHALWQCASACPLWLY